MMEMGLTALAMPIARAAVRGCGGVGYAPEQRPGLLEKRTAGRRQNDIKFPADTLEVLAQLPANVSSCLLIQGYVAVFRSGIDEAREAEVQSY